MSDNQLTIEQGTISRYCKPTMLNDEGWPTAAAFRCRPNETYLSVHLLDFFTEVEREREQMDAIKAYMQTRLNLSKNGVLSTLDIGKTLQFIKQSPHFDVNTVCEIKDEGLPHCGVYHNDDDAEIAEHLRRCVENNYLVKELK